MELTLGERRSRRKWLVGGGLFRQHRPVVEISDMMDGMNRVSWMSTRVYVCVAVVSHAYRSFHAPLIGRTSNRVLGLGRKNQASTNARDTLKELDSHLHNFTETLAKNGKGSTLLTTIYSAKTPSLVTPLSPFA